MAFSAWPTTRIGMRAAHQLATKTARAPECPENTTKVSRHTRAAAAGGLEAGRREGGHYSVAD